jgi:hypothetical protein
MNITGGGCLSRGTFTGLRYRLPHGQPFTVRWRGFASRGAQGSRTCSTCGPACCGDKAPPSAENRRNHLLLRTQLSTTEAVKKKRAAGCTSSRSRGGFSSKLLFTKLGTTLSNRCSHSSAVCIPTRLASRRNGAIRWPLLDWCHSPPNGHTVNFTVRALTGDDYGICTYG